MIHPLDYLSILISNTNKLVPLSQRIMVYKHVHGFSFSFSFLFLKGHIGLFLNAYNVCDFDNVCVL